MKKHIWALWLPLLAATALLSALPALATEEADPLPHSHTVESWTITENSHSGLCTGCGETVTEEHSFDDGVEALAPTCQLEGTRTFTCSACSATKEEAISKLPDHVYNEWTPGEDQHTGTCIHCGEVLTKEHSYGEGIVTLEPTCSTEGSKLYTCADCGHTKTEILSTIEHTMDEGVVAEEPTCQADGKRVFTCSGCGTTEEESIPKLPDHVYNEWTPGEDQHTGTCIHCGEVLTKEHSYGEGIVTLEPTCQAEGKKTFTCICGHSFEETIPMLTDHGINEWTFDENGHTGTCIHCSEVLTGEHNYGDGVITLEPTCQAEGKKTFTCICGHSFEEAIPALTDHVVNEWTFDENGHTGTCIHCNEVLTGEHNYGDGIITLEPTCQAEGKKTFTCICGNSYEETIPMLTDHVVNNWIYNETGHIGTCIHCNEELTIAHSFDEGVITLEPTCTADGSKTLTCTECGHTTQETIPTPGHIFGAWKDLDETYHKRTCACGKTEKKKHAWDKGVAIRKPACDIIGLSRYTCTDCGRTKKAQTYTLPHTYSNSCDITCNVCGGIRRPNHNFSTKWSTDGTSHWHECTVCSAATDQESHTPTDWIVDLAPGEYSDGKQHKECTVCDLILETVSIPATGCLHGNEELRNKKDPTCTEEGHTGDWVCPRCNAIVTPGEAIPMLPHTPEIENQKDPTCTEEGYTGDHICQICRTTTVAGEAIPVLPHNTTVENQKDATCTEEGYTGDHICQDCQTTTAHGEVIPTLPHNTAVENQKDATCTEEGYSGDLICQDCQATTEPGEVIPTLPHNTAVENQKDATCTEEGYSGDHICQDCRATVTAGDVIPVLPHDTELHNMKVQTCTTDGYTGDLVCKICNQVIEPGQTVASTGHSFTEGFCQACGETSPDFVLPGATHPSGGDYEKPPLSPVVIAAMAMLAIAGVGIVVLIVLMAKKK